MIVAVFVLRKVSVSHAAVQHHQGLFHFVDPALWRRKFCCCVFTFTLQLPNFSSQFDYSVNMLSTMKHCLTLTQYACVWPEFGYMKTIILWWTCCQSSKHLVHDETWQFVCDRKCWWAGNCQIAAEIGFGSTSISHITLWRKWLLFVTQNASKLMLHSWIVKEHTTNINRLRL